MARMKALVAAFVPLVWRRVRDDPAEEASLWGGRLCPRQREDGISVHRQYCTFSLCAVELMVNYQSLDIATG